MTVQPIDPNISPERATEAFNKAVGNSNWRQVRDLARTGKVAPDVLAGALVKSIKWRRSGTLVTLIENGADLTKAPADIAIEAMRFNDHQGVIALLENGADLHEQDDELLIRALSQQRKALAEKLIERGANVNAQDGKPLVAAIHADMSHHCQLLLEKGAEPSLGGNAPLVAAIMSKNQWYYKKLIKHEKLDITAGENAALFAATTQRRMDYMKELISMGADPCARKGAVLIQAAKSGFAAGVKLLIEHSPEVSRYAHRASVEAVAQKAKMPNQKTPHLDAVIEYLSPYALRHMLALKKLTARNRRTAP